MANHAHSEPFVIAALGASAGGLEACETFFKHMPPDAGIAFAIVMHLAPDHESALAQLLGRDTQMSVEQVHDQTTVVPNRVYVIPPNATLTIEHRVLRVMPPTEPRGYRTPIDNLFVSLAEDLGELAVCIMLSGTGSDGTLGLRAIKEHGGMAMAQTPESAKHDAILRSAIGTGLVDHVLPVEDMPAKLAKYAAYLSSLDGKPNRIRDQIRTHLAKIHALLRRRTGHDFSQYKGSTFARRLERRMKALQIGTVSQYVGVLESRPEESEQLFKDLLIGVTEFFRDPNAFEALARVVIPKLFEGKGAGDQVRVGVVGCSSGEEAYSIAILLSEHAGTLNIRPKLQIFATDIDERALGMARKGSYPETIADLVSPERLERFFTRQQDGTYLVKREIREICIFSAHSFIKDPPFSRLDLICCRNVMIYLEPDLQRNIIPLFHYALRPGGYLFLGPAESVSSNPELFRTTDKTHRIFQRKETVPRPAVKFPLAQIPGPPQSGEKRLEDRHVPKQLERIILQRYGPACALVRENGDAVYFSGRIGRYLEQPTGTPEINVLNMAREGLRIPLRTSLHRAVTAQARAVEKHVVVQAEGELTNLDLTIEPFVELGDTGLFMIVFEEASQRTSPQPGDAPAANGGLEQTIQQLESELRAAREHAQAAYEELETSNEELKSANEEYQSTNEELETSKEELQSFNEELETVNAELNRKVSELDSANSDLQNLFNGTQIATIFLDSALRIRSFTPTAASAFRLIPGDVGRPLADLASQFSEGGLVEDMKEVLQTLSMRERALTGTQGRYYQMRILPYRTTHDVIDGVVVTFFDVTRLKETEQRAVAARIYAENIVQTVRQPLLVLGGDMRVQSANRSFYELFKLSDDTVEGKVLFDIANGLWNLPELRRMLGEVLPQRKAVRDFRVDLDSPGVAKRIILVSARQIQPQKDEAPLILLALDDITESKEQLLRVNEELKHIAYATSHDLQEPLRMVISYVQLLEKEYKGKLDSTADQFIGYAVEGASRMERLLKDLREYWSVNEHWLEHPVPVDCAALCDGAIEMLRAHLEESSGKVTHGPLPTVMAEEVPLKLLFQNLIANAIKYHRQGEPPVIHISAQREPGFWHFSVADNGIGIEAQYLKAIFAPFKRLHGLDEYSGSGIGLAICQKIVERCGGEIWAESIYGEGSTFHFTIPDTEGPA